MAGGCGRRAVGAGTDGATRHRTDGDGQAHEGYRPTRNSGRGHGCYLRSSGWRSPRRVVHPCRCAKPGPGLMRPHLVPLGCYLIAVGRVIVVFHTTTRLIPAVMALLIVYPSEHPGVEAPRSQASPSLTALRSVCRRTEITAPTLAAMPVSWPMPDWWFAGIDVQVSQRAGGWAATRHSRSVRPPLPGQRG